MIFFVSYDVHMVLLSWGMRDPPASFWATLLRRLLSTYVTLDLIIFIYMSILCLPWGEKQTLISSTLSVSGVFKGILSLFACGWRINIAVWG